MSPTSLHDFLLTLHKVTCAAPVPNPAGNNIMRDESHKLNSRMLENTIRSCMSLFLQKPQATQSNDDGLKLRPSAPAGN
eukprot:1366741-Amphidinium_carterae.1